MPKKEKKKDSTAKKTTPSEPVIPAGIPPEFVEMLDERIDGRIDAALERFKPEIAEAVKGAMQQVVAEATKAGVIRPPGGANIPGTNLPEGGVIPGSPITSDGAALLNYLVSSQKDTNLIPVDVQKQLMVNLLGRIAEPATDQFQTYRTGQMDMLRTMTALTRRKMPDLTDTLSEGTPP